MSFRPTIVARNDTDARDIEAGNLYSHTINVRAGLKRHLMRYGRNSPLDCAELHEMIAAMERFEKRFHDMEA